MNNGTDLNFTQMLKGISTMVILVVLLLSPHLSKKVKQEIENRESIQAQLSSYKIKIAKKRI